jgi:uncharacterized surface protein with fasciclin (FAS1) repeats
MSTMRFQKFFIPRTMLLGAGMLVLLSSCDKDDDDPPAPSSTITDLVVADANFSLLEQAVLKANLAATLSGTGPFTVFAPDDAAFAASGLNSAAVNALSQADASGIILYHALGAEIRSTDVPAGPNAKVVTASGDSVYVTRNSNGVFVNGVRVTTADIDADNGVIHKIGRVLLPPGNKTIVDVAEAGGLDSLVKAVLRADSEAGGAPGLANTLGSATLTVFAPTNQAFTNLLSALGLTDINQIPIGTLVAVLQYHVVSGRAFSSDLANTTLPMLAGGSTTINLTNGTGGGPTIRGNGNSGNASNIVSTNIMARNGVVHLIDRVLLP